MAGPARNADVFMKGFTTYKPVLDFLYDQLPMYQRMGKSAYKADLSNTLVLDRFLRYPHHAYLTVHVAGTNGKGSVSHIITSILQAHGYRVGLYTSPHLKDFRERIKVNGDCVPESFVIDFVNRCRPVIHDVKPSFFELTVAMAYDYFRTSGVDLAVIETGLGGRLDSTNIIVPVVSVITNIGHDHQEFLGKNLEAIAREKAGIIKSEIPVIIGETQPGVQDIFIRKATEMDAPIRFADQEIKFNHALQTMTHKQKLFLEKNGKPFLEGLETDLAGFYQPRNVITALGAVESMRLLGIPIRQDAIFEGVASVSDRTGFFGRWQVLGHQPLVVCDAAHNREGIAQVVHQIRNTPHKDLFVVMGLVREKDPGEILDQMPKNARYYFVKANIPRAMEAEVLAKKAGGFGLKGEVCPSVQAGLDMAKKAAGKEDMVFVTGSTYVVAEVI